VNLSRNYFELFGLPEQFDVDLKRLSSCYQELQKALHPDKFANASERERVLSLQQAGMVNSAFQTLKDPLARAKYLLELRGIISHDEKTTIRDPEFLEQQMELREELAEIRFQSDPLTALLDFMAELDGAVRGSVVKLAELFAVGDQEALQDCRQRVHQLQFLYKLRQEAEALEEELM